MKKTVLLFSAFLITSLAWFFLIDVGEYPELNTCFKTSVSKKLLCSKNLDYVPLTQVSKYFLKAVVMSEDDKFYLHEGFDWKELRKSMSANFRQFAFVRGGSTITQQLVKNVYLNRKKTISRKIVEAKLAKRIEQKHSKKLILEKYVNAIEFGKDLWGIKKASFFYFKKPPALLSPVESLYLVVLLPSPVKYSKTFFEKNLSPYQKKRMLVLLRRMKRRNILGDKEFEEAKIELNYFFKESDIEDFSPEPIEIEDLEDAQVVEPEDGEMAGTDEEPNDVEDPDEDLSLDASSDFSEPEEESYAEEEGVVLDEEPDLDEDSVEDLEDQP